MSLLSVITKKIDQLFQKSNKFLKFLANPFFTPIFTVFNYVAAKKMLETNLQNGTRKEIIISITTIVSFAYLSLYLWLALYQIFKGKKEDV